MVSELVSNCKTSSSQIIALSAAANASAASLYTVQKHNAHRFLRFCIIFCFYAFFLIFRVAIFYSSMPIYFVFFRDLAFILAQAGDQGRAVASQSQEKKEPAEKATKINSSAALNMHLSVSSMGLFCLFRVCFGLRCSFRVLFVHIWSPRKVVQRLKKTKH